MADRPRKSKFIVLATLLLALGSVFIFLPASGPRSMRAFDPDRTAALELDMWQAYYHKETARLFRGLVTLLHEQYRYSWGKATTAGFYLARAARTFSDLRSDYDRVLPDLERAYAIARDWTEAHFDPAAVSRAELAWWVARRDPRQNSAENVGSLIAEEYALLYEVPRDRVINAALLRARAGKLRDEGGDNANWPAVSRLLIESYRELHTAVAR